MPNALARLNEVISTYNAAAAIAQGKQTPAVLAGNNMSWAFPWLVLSQQQDTHITCDSRHGVAHPFP